MLEDDPRATLLFALAAVECHAKRIENLGGAGRVGSHPLRTAEGAAASFRITSRKITREVESVFRESANERREDFVQL